MGLSSGTLGTSSTVTSEHTEKSTQQYEQKQGDGQPSVDKPEPTGGSKGSYSLSEVAKHTDAEKGGVWITMEGKVYDVTEWLDEHPGGFSVLYDRAGEECSLAFERIGHTEKALRIRDSLCIGELAQKEQGKQGQGQPKGQDKRRNERKAK